MAEKAVPDISKADKEREKCRVAGECLCSPEGLIKKRCLARTSDLVLKATCKPISSNRKLFVAVMLC